MHLKAYVFSSAIATGWCEMHSGILGWMWTLNWNSTWAAADDVSQVHKNTSTDKNAD